MKISVRNDKIQQKQDVSQPHNNLYAFYSGTVRYNMTRKHLMYLLSIRNKYVPFYIMYLFVELLQLSWGLEGQAAADV